MAGLGLDAAIITGAPPILKAQLGWTAYVVSAAKNINHPSVKVRIVLDDDEALERRVRTVVIGNVGMLQANIPLLPDARPDDGLIDVVIIAPRRVTQWPLVFWRVMTRTKRTEMYLERFTGRKVEITADRRRPTPTRRRRHRPRPNPHRRGRPRLPGGPGPQTPLGPWPDRQVVDSAGRGRGPDAHAADRRPRSGLDEPVGGQLAAVLSPWRIDCCGPWGSALRGSLGVGRLLCGGFRGLLPPRATAWRRFRRT